MEITLKGYKNVRRTLQAGIAGSELRLRLRRGDITAIWRKLHRLLQGHPVG